jgi:hypothetical protein
MRKGIAAAGAVCLALIGVVHDVVGLPSWQRAVSRGLIAPRIAPQFLLNWLFSGVMIVVLGILVLVAVKELDRPSRLARWVIALTGLLFVAVGVVSYAVEPRPRVLVFTVLGLMICGPLASLRATSRS